MEMRVATWADVESVLDRLCDANREEYARVGFPSEVFNLRLLRFMLDADTHCLWFDDRPQAFIAISKGKPTTWLGLTAECMNRGAGPIKIGRAHMRQMVERVGPIHSLITSPHQRIVKWMHLLGAELVEEKDIVRVFRFA